MDDERTFRSTDVSPDLRRPAVRAIDAAEPPTEACPKPVAPAVSTGIGLLLGPALTLPEFTRGKFAAGKHRVGHRENYPCFDGLPRAPLPSAP